MNKYLEKIAFEYKGFDHAFDTAMARTSNRGTLKAGLVGAAIMGGLGARATKKPDPNGKPGEMVSISNKERAGRTAALATLGAVYAGSMAHMVKKIKIGDFVSNRVYDTLLKGRAHRGFSAASAASHGDIKSHFKDMGYSGSHTKKDVHSFYKRQAMKLHPDRGGSASDMESLNAAYQKVKNHPDFVKMAGIISRNNNDTK